jgi:MoxR-like ATPase
VAAIASTPQHRDGSWVANATYREKPSELDRPLPMAAWMEHGINRRRTIHFMGDHGTGKTASITAWAADHGYRMVYVNLANITPDDKLAVAPKRMADGSIVLQQMITEDLVPDQPYIMYLDDARQASQRVQNQFMQLTCHWTLGGHTLPNLKLVVMSDNEGVTEGIRTSEDLAVADRKVTIRITANDTGWRYALARKYADVDLKGVFGVWDSLDGELRHTLSPRALDHVIYCALNGFPLIFGLPLMAGSRVRLIGKTARAGETSDRTSEILDRIAQALGVRNPEPAPDAAVRAIQAALRDRLTILIQGPPGCGKTEVTKELVAAAGLDLVYKSMPFTDPETLVAPVPSQDGTLSMLIAEELTATEPYALVWDEYNRPSSPAAFAKLMEITQQWSIAGIDLDACRAQIALCNPPEFNGRRLAVSKNNLAQADRFTISLEIGPDDLSANEWLIKRYGNVAEIVLEWFKNDIADEHRQWITKRTLERFIGLHLDGLPLEQGKIYLGDGEYAPVPLIDLQARLARKPMTRLAEIAANADAWEERVRRASELSLEGTNDVDAVHQALTLAELSQLRDHIAVVPRLVRYLPPKLRGTFFIGASDEKQEFWIEVMQRMTKLPK